LANGKGQISNKILKADWALWDTGINGIEEDGIRRDEWDRNGGMTGINKIKEAWMEVIIINTFVL
jgi:hypothetical protein